MFFFFCSSKSGGKSWHHNIETGSLFGFFFLFETVAFSVTSHFKLFAVIRGTGSAPKQESFLQPVAYPVSLLLRSFSSLFPLLSLIRLLFCSPHEHRGKKNKEIKEFALKGQVGVRQQCTSESQRREPQKRREENGGGKNIQIKSEKRCDGRRSEGFEQILKDGSAWACNRVYAPKRENVNPGSVRLRIINGKKHQKSIQ